MDTLDEDHVQLAETVIQSARFISVMLDAAMDVTQKQHTKIS
jgi:hypothetical protein